MDDDFGRLANESGEASIPFDLMEVYVEEETMYRLGAVLL